MLGVRRGGGSANAQRVLSRAEHVLQGVRLEVRPAAPRDYGKVVLQGLSPRSSQDLVELYVEHMLRCERGDYALFRSPDGDQALVQLQGPLSHTEFLALAEHVKSRPLDGAPLTLDWPEQTESLLVQSRGGEPLREDLLELYFESKRSGGGPVRAVRILPGATMAVVSFQDRAVAERVRQRPHQLPGVSLDICPHYDFLEPTEGKEGEEAPREGGGPLPRDEETPPVTCIPLLEEASRRLLRSSLVLQELGVPVPECSLQLDGPRLCISGGDPVGQSRLEAHVRVALREMVREHLPFSSWELEFLRREDVQQGLAELLAEQRVGACFLPPDESGVVAVALTAPSAHLAASLLASALTRFSLPLSERHLLVLASPSWDHLQEVLRCCLVRLAENGEHLEGLTLVGLEPENVRRLEAFLWDSVPDETVVAMEPAQLRFLQLYHQEVLAGMTDVTPLPLEGEDITGLRHELERSWDPLALSCQRDSPHGSRWSGAPDDATCDQSGADMDIPHGLPSPPSFAAQIRCLLAALQPPNVATSVPEAGGHAGGETVPAGAEEEDLYTAAPVAPLEKEGVQDSIPPDPEVIEAGPLPGTVVSASDEEAELLLAIQQSMDSVRQEEEEIRQATELSLLSWQQEQVPSPDSDAAALRSAMSVSLEANDSAQLVVCAESEANMELLVQELEAALRAHMRVEEVAHQALRSPPALCLDYLTHLEQRHAVRISLADSVATVRGLVEYPVGATRDIALLVSRFLRTTEAPEGSGGAYWVRWEASGRGSPTPYSTQASALLEQAWRQGHKRLDVFFDGRPFTFDFERMEEYDLGNACTLPIGRTEPPPIAAPEPFVPPVLTEEEVTLVPLVEGSEEFRETVRHFYDALEGFHNKIRLVKVEKLVHPLLYQQYQLKKAAMEKACGHQQVERVLYHGTAKESTREICLHGFNRSFCGKNGTRYGHGVYFTRKAFISAQDQYSPCSGNGDKYIFVTLTLVGDYAVGKPGMRAPPFREGDPALRRYDSTVDNTQDPSIFVIFNDTQAYPLYLITCQWSKTR
ncbi:hypothetical protein JD844_015325 [Phrynosoma platyrhinos]|uniref:Poly [ADP-ribose] polymerase n=1 Tax=Phrynosoma platyrhinos TaxID=52577 RepID=A0ABQ7SIZ1_PHRPL|nr:hypothetical protein JD844_015325 [Phrynosoma platyrhinos]